MNTGKSRWPIFSHFHHLYLLYKKIYGEEARCILFFFRSVFSARPMEEILNEHDKPILSAWVANQNAVFISSRPLKFQSLTRQELVLLPRDQALLLLFFSLFLEREGGGGKKCEKCLNMQNNDCLLVTIYMSYCTCVVFKLEGFGQLLSDGNNKQSNQIQ